jgi:hypothetical protein
MTHRNKKSEFRAAARSREEGKVNRSHSNAISFDFTFYSI